MFILCSYNPTNMKSFSFLVMSSTEICCRIQTSPHHTCKHPLEEESDYVVETFVSNASYIMLRQTCIKRHIALITCSGVANKLKFQGCQALQLFVKLKGYLTEQGNITKVHPTNRRRNLFLGPLIKT